MDDTSPPHSRRRFRSSLFQRFTPSIRRPPGIRVMHPRADFNPPDVRRDFNPRRLRAVFLPMTCYPDGLIWSHLAMEYHGSCWSHRALDPPSGGHGCIHMLFDVLLFDVLLTKSSCQIRNRYSSSCQIRDR
jgi:hypothetical protein